MHLFKYDNMRALNIQPLSVTICRMSRVTNNVWMSKIISLTHTVSSRAWWCLFQFVHHVWSTVLHRYANFRVTAANWRTRSPIVDACLSRHRPFRWCGMRAIQPYWMMGTAVELWNTRRWHFLELFKHIPVWLEVVITNINVWFLWHMEHTAVRVIKSSVIAG